MSHDALPYMCPARTRSTAQDVWSGKAAAEDDDDEPRGEALDDDAGRSPTTQKGKKDNKKKKNKKKKEDTGKSSGATGKRKRLTDDQEPWKRARALVTLPTCMNQHQQSETQEPLFHNAYHGNVYKQVWAEWGAKACVLYTPGNGEAAIQAVQSEFPLLCLALNSVHAEVLVWFADCAVANAIQVHWAGNRLHDAELRKKIVHAFGEATDSDTDESENEKKTGGKKDKKDKKEKKDKKTGGKKNKKTGGKKDKKEKKTGGKTGGKQDKKNKTEGSEEESEESEQSLLLSDDLFSEE